uniref:Chromosome 1 open reading frame 43 n=1 Tax=Oryzias sinensis TaxID=183150 RepID=A0A8C7YAR5_9TELE
MGDNGVNVVLVMAYGSLIFLLLFVFVKRQVMRLAMKSRRGPHAPIGHNVPKKWKQEIEAKLIQVQKIHFEPRLLSPGDDRLTQPASYDYLYRMKALDAIRDTGEVSSLCQPSCMFLFLLLVLNIYYPSITSLLLPDFPFRELGGASTAVTGKRFRTWLLNIRNSHCMFRDRQSMLIDTVLDGYTKARHGAEAFGEEEFLKYQEALVELASIVKSGGSSTASQLHQSAAADLSSPSEPPGASVSPDQTAYLMSSLQQRSKKPRHFLELKNFKDNYNTLDNIA